MTDDPLAIARAIGLALERAGASWAIGGSVASSVHGIPRTTHDLDVVVAMAPSAAAVLEREAEDFVVDAVALRSQLLQGRAYNVFHARTMTKIDLFPAVGPFERNQLDRASLVAGVRVVSAEDALLAKLRWYRAGGEVSDRQWRDVAGLVAVQADRLDRAHLDRWALELGVADLLAKALTDHSGGF